MLFFWLIVNIIEELALVRLAVSKLSGEAGWIPTFGDDQVEMLRYALPRTAEAAGAQLACTISARQHDEQVGLGSYHLFRLPADVEGRLREVQRQSERWATLLREPPATSLRLIEQLAAGTAVGQQAGPVSVGRLAELTPTDGRRLLAYAARHYLTAHTEGYRTFPYLSQE